MSEIIYPLGRVKSNDPRNAHYPYARRATQIVSKRWQRHVDPFNQGQLGSCTGNAGVGLLATDPYWDTIQSFLNSGALTLDEPQAVKVYSAATKIDDVKGQYPPTDTGSSGPAVAQVLKNAGFISGYTHIQSFDDLLAALMDHPVITGVGWYNNMFQPDAHGIVTVPSDDTLAGGHEFVLDEVDTSRELIGATNSWGLDWGLRGRFYIPFSLMQRLLNEDGDATAFVPVTQPAPTPVPPTPSPSPQPTPTPVPVDSDTILWNSVSDWTTHHHTGSNKAAQNAVIEWAKAKGFIS